MPIHALQPYLALPFATTSTNTPLLLTVSRHSQQLLMLEQQIACVRDRQEGERLLNEYLDASLNEADAAGQRHLLPLQESWLNRCYLTLRQATLNPDAPLHWRSLCFDYLYQPFFALQHLYISNPQQKRKLRNLLHEFRSLGRLFSVDC